MAKSLEQAPNDEHVNWYVRRGSAVQGPYASRQIARYLLLGRIRQTDRVSIDGEMWQGLSEVPHLIPDEMKDLDSEEGRARFLAAHLRADERGGERAASVEVTMPGWRGRKERRHGSVVDEFDYVRRAASRYVDIRHRSGSLSKAAFLSARNDALANVAIIAAGLLTAHTLSVWPDLVVGLGIEAINADAARQVWMAAKKEHLTAEA